VPGGTKNNYAFVQNDVTFPEHMDQTSRWILCDAVTSGGLLISIPEEHSGLLMHELVQAGVEASLIGEITGEQPGHILVK
jgi:selenide,water dikinase